MDTLIDNRKRNVAPSREDALQARLGELHREFQTGEAQLEDLDRRRAQVRYTLLRISGAIQVLKEVLNQEQVERLASGTCESLKTMPAAGQE
jgi:hypothetical protein